MAVSAEAHNLRELEQDPRLFLYTSLTAGSSHIITATSRMETILKANRIPFQAIDTATDEKARRLWQRRAGKRKLPGLVKEGFVVGDLEEVEEWNEYGELKENIGPVPGAAAVPAPKLPVKTTATGGTAGGSSSKPTETASSQQRVALPGAAEIAARSKAAVASKSSSNPSTVPTSGPTSASDAAKPETMTSPPKSKLQSVKIAGHVSGEDHLSAPPSQHQSGTTSPVEAAAPAESEGAVPASAVPKALQADHPNLDHLSAPPSRLASGTATPAEPDEEAKENPASAIPKSLQADHSGLDHLSAPPSRLASGTATPAEPDEQAKEKPASAIPKGLQTDHSGLDHLSAPPSRLASGTATPAEPAEEATKENTKPDATAAGDGGIADLKSEDRGSEIKEAPGDVVENVEESASKGVEGLQTGDGVDVQEQGAKDGMEAGKSVED